MSDVLVSLKKDLLGRRLLPILLLLGLALVGAVAYAVLGGGSGSQTPAASLSAPGSLPPAPTTLASPAPANPNVAVSETTSGAHYQRGGPTRNPFTKLPGSKAEAASKTEAKTSTTGSTSSPSSPGAGSKSLGGGTTPTTPEKSTPKPSKPKVLQRTYQVALLFGLAPPAGQNPQLTPYVNLTRLTPLPSKENALLVYSGVGPSGKGAIFTLLHEAILKGGGICLPSASQCEAIDMPVGQTEELQYLGSSGQPVTYLLQVVSIVKHEVTFQPVARSARVSRAGRKLLRAAGLAVTGELRYRPAKDVVVFTASGHRH